MNLRLVASLLGRGRQLERLSDGISLLALACSLAPLFGLSLAWPPRLLCLLLVLLGLLHKYWALRVALDAELFNALAASRDLAADTQALDRALHDLRLKPEPSDKRDWPARSQGALALLRRQALCLGMQLLLILTLPFTG